MRPGLSRRAFLAGGASLAGIGSVSVLVPQGAAAAVLTPTTLKKLAYRRSTFLPLVGQAFQIIDSQGSITVVLRQVADLQPTVRPGTEDQFSLIFREAAAQPALAQGTYSIGHAGQGRISLFVVPVGPRQATQKYQAVIDSRPLATIS